MSASVSRCDDDEGSGELTVRPARRRSERYLKPALKYHPDRNPGNQEAEENSRRRPRPTRSSPIAQKRSLYDRFGHAGVSNAAGAGGFDPTIFADFSDIFSGLGDAFGFGDLFGGRRRRGGPQRGADLRYDLEISFEESATGTETTIQIPREEACEPVQGRAPHRGRAPRRVRNAKAPGSCATSRASSRWRGRVPTAAEPARRLPSRVRAAAAPGASAASDR